jgi:hypothetical protein
LCSFGDEISTAHQARSDQPTAIFLGQMGMDKYTAAGADRSAGAESDEMSQSRDRVHDMLGAVSSHVLDNLLLNSSNNVILVTSTEHSE